MKKLLYILLFIPVALFGQSTAYIEQDSPLELYQGWNMFGYSCYEPIGVATAFTSINDKIVIVKDNSGNVYMPEFTFNGIGDLVYNRGYQIKLSEAITDFQFCPAIVPLVEGCMDETAFNYNSSANMDNGSCYPIVLGCLDPTAFNYNDYDNDGYSNEISGINGVDVNTTYGMCIPVINGCIDINADNYSTSANTDNGSCIYYGCIDESACNYDTEANTDDNACEYPNPGYDCFGNDLENCYYPDSITVEWFNESYPQLMSGPCLDINLASYYSVGFIIENSNFDSIPWLEHFTNLEYLTISNNDSLISIPELSGMTNLISLTITYNESLTSLPELSNLINLSSLNIKNDGLTSLPELSGLANLIELHIGGYSLTNLPDLSSLSNLSYFTVISTNSLTSLPELSSLINLSGILIENNYGLTSLPELSGLTNLTNLSIDNNAALTSLPNLSELNNLSILFIRFNDVLTIIPNISGLINLSDLYIGYNDNLECVIGGYPEQLTIEENWPPVCTLEVGDYAHGGIVFYVDSTGEHGLVAAMEDLPGTYEWGCWGSGGDYSGADVSSIGTGYQNTLNLVLGCSETDVAASEALAYESGGYSDWYLPSIDELLEMYYTIGGGSLDGNIGGFSVSWYWSSSKYIGGSPYIVHFSDGSSGISVSSSNVARVRVIRAF